MQRKRGRDEYGLPLLLLLLLLLLLIPDAPQQGQNGGRSQLPDSPDLLVTCEEAALRMLPSEFQNFLRITARASTTHKLLVHDAIIIKALIRKHQICPFCLSRPLLKLPQQTFSFTGHDALKMTRQPARHLRDLGLAQSEVKTSFFHSFLSSFKCKCVVGRRQAWPGLNSFGMDGKPSR